MNIKNKAIEAAKEKKFKSTRTKSIKKKTPGNENTYIGDTQKESEMPILIL